MAYPCNCYNKTICLADRFPVTARPSDQCPDGQDIVFAIDASSSVGRNNFRRLTEGLLRVIERFNLERYNSGDSSKVRVGILTFANFARQVKRLDEFTLPRAEDIRYMRGRTRTDSAI